MRTMDADAFLSWLDEAEEELKNEVRKDDRLDRKMTESYSRQESSVSMWRRCAR